MLSEALTDIKALFEIAQGCTWHLQKKQTFHFESLIMRLYFWDE